MVLLTVILVAGVIVTFSLATKFKGHESVIFFTAIIALMAMVFIYDECTEISDKAYIRDESNYSTYLLICDGEFITENLCYSHGCYYRENGGYYEAPNEYHPTLLLVSNGKRTHYSNFTITKVGGDTE